MSSQGDSDASPEEEALAELLREKLEEVKSGEIVPQIRETSVGKEEDSIESEFARAAAKLPPEERAASTRREIENIFEVAEGEVRDWAENFKEERRLRSELAKKKVADEMAAEQRSFEMKLDALVSEDAGIDKEALRRALSDVSPEIDDDTTNILNEIIPPPSKDVPRQAQEISFSESESLNWPPPPGASIALITPESGDKKPLVDTRAISEEIKAMGYSPVLDTSKEVAAAIVVCDETFSSGPGLVKRVVDGLKEGGGLVLASRQGSTQLGSLALAWKNARSGGGVTKARETEDAAKLAAAAVNKALSVTIVRFGDILSSDAKGLTIASGDSLDAPSSTLVAARALAQATLAAPAARNASFTVSGGKATEIDWQDEFLKLQGPELLRLEAKSGSTMEELVLWLSEWARLFREPYSQGLTTPVDVQAADDGATLLFYDKQQRASLAKKPSTRRRIAKLGGVRLLAESDPRNPAGLRLRAIRQPYDPDIAIKEMSEQAILDKLKRDFGSQWGS